MNIKNRDCVSCETQLESKQNLSFCNTCYSFNDNANYIELAEIIEFLGKHKFVSRDGRLVKGQKYIARFLDVDAAIISRIKKHKYPYQFKSHSLLLELYCVYKASKQKLVEEKHGLKCFSCGKSIGYNSSGKCSYKLLSFSRNVDKAIDERNSFYRVSCPTCYDFCFVAQKMSYKGLLGYLIRSTSFSFFEGLDGENTEVKYDWLVKNTGIDRFKLSRIKKAKIIKLKEDVANNIHKLFINRYKQQQAYITKVEEVFLKDFEYPSEKIDKMVVQGKYSCDFLLCNFHRKKTICYLMPYSKCSKKQLNYCTSAAKVFDATYVLMIYSENQVQVYKKQNQTIVGKVFSELKLLEPVQSDEVEHNDYRKLGNIEELLFRKKSNTRKSNFIDTILPTTRSHR